MVLLGRRALLLSEITAPKVLCVLAHPVSGSVHWQLCCYFSLTRWYFRSMWWKPEKCPDRKEGRVHFSLLLFLYCFVKSRKEKHFKHKIWFLLNVTWIILIKKSKGLLSLEHFNVLLVIPINILLAKYLLEDNYKTIFSNLRHEVQLDFCSENSRKKKKAPLWKKIYCR